MDTLRALGLFLLRVEEDFGDRALTLSWVSRDSQEPLGKVMIEEGRLCWATARDSTVRLNELILRETRLNAEDLRERYAEALERGSPFGESLVSEGLLEAVTLRRLLLEQIVGALSVMLRDSANAPTRWTETDAPTRTHSPAFTFSGPEVMMAFVTHDVEAALEAPPAPLPFLEALERISPSVCLLQTHEPPMMYLPMQISPDVDLSYSQVQRLARHAHRLLMTPALVALGIRPHLAFCAADPEGLLVARAGHHWLVARPRRMVDAIPVIGSFRDQLDASPVLT